MIIVILITSLWLTVFSLFFFSFLYETSLFFPITDLSGDFNVFFKLCLRLEKIVLFQIGSKNLDPFDANAIRISVVRLYNFHNLFWLRVQLIRYFTNINKFATVEFWHGVFVLSLWEYKVNVHEYCVYTFLGNTER